MARRALRKIDPELDLSRHYRETDDLPKPLDRTLLFERHAPLEIEVGSGKGLFLATASQANPEHDFLGIEVARKYAHFTAARLKKLGATNAMIACGDALAVFRDRVEDSTLAAVHVYFPDPWWKKRHRQRRVLNESFLTDIERTLHPRRLAPFLDRRGRVLPVDARAHRCRAPLSPARSPSRSARRAHLDFRTHFERRTRLHELPVYRSEFRRPLPGERGTGIGG